MSWKFAVDRRLMKWFSGAAAALLLAAGLGTACAQSIQLPAPAPVGDKVTLPATPAELPAVLPAAAEKPAVEEKKTTPNPIAVPQTGPSTLMPPVPGPVAEAVTKILATEPQATPAAAPKTETAPADTTGVVPVGCTNCGPKLPPPSGGCDTCGGDGCHNGLCYPGRKPCDCCFGDSCLGRFFGGIYECICCPDPCYEPHWIAVADSAFFLDAARPKTQMRIDIDSAWDLPLPDRAEWFWAQENKKGPHVPGGAGVRHLDYYQFSLYAEAAADRAGLVIVTPYLMVDPSDVPGHSGFGDIQIAAKSMLLDCELMQLTFQFKTYVPSGNFLEGLGTGHASLEPSLLMNLRLDEDMYLQSQLAYWIPVGGDDIQGTVIHWHLALNKVLWKPCCDIQLVGSAEADGWDIMNGQYTGIDGKLGGADEVGNIVNLGGGVRLFICDKIDLGIGATFGVTHDTWAESMVRGEFRWRF